MAKSLSPLKAECAHPLAIEGRGALLLFGQLESVWAGSQGVERINISNQRELLFARCSHIAGTLVTLAGQAAEDQLPRLAARLRPILSGFLDDDLEASVRITCHHSDLKNSWREAIQKPSPFVGPEALHVALRLADRYLTTDAEIALDFAAEALHGDQVTAPAVEKKQSKHELAVRARRILDELSAARENSSLVTGPERAQLRTEVNDLQDMATTLGGKLLGCVSAKAEADLVSEPARIELALKPFISNADRMRPPVAFILERSRILQRFQFTRNGVPYGEHGLKLALAFADLHLD